MRGLMPETAGPNEVLVRYGDDGKVNVYEVYDSTGLPIKRVDVRGPSHAKVPTPHVQEFITNTNPRTEITYIKMLKGKPRKARPDEVLGL